MARRPHPWYYEARNAWYVYLDGKKNYIAEHPKGAPKPRKRQGRWNAPKEIQELFHKMLVQGPEVSTNDETVVEVLDDFIAWCYENRAKKTTDRYKELIQDFVQSYGRVRVSELTSSHLTAWLNTHERWNSTTKKNAITAVSRGFNWAVKNRGLAKNPIKGMEKPVAKKRTDIVTPEEFEKLLNAIPDQRFRDLLIVSYDAGGRPFEVKDLEKRHCQVDKHRAVIPADEAKGRKDTRTIYFPTERSMELITRLCEQYPEGPLFRNRLGNKWTGMAVKCRLEDLDHVLGRRVTHYSLRHSRITDWLVSGVDSHIVAKLSGHKDSRMIDTTYSHVQEDYEYMLKNARKKTTDEDA